MSWIVRELPDGRKLSANILWPTILVQYPSQALRLIPKKDAIIQTRLQI